MADDDRLVPGRARPHFSPGQGTPSRGSKVVFTLPCPKCGYPRNPKDVGEPCARCVWEAEGRDPNPLTWMLPKVSLVVEQPVPVVEPVRPPRGLDPAIREQALRLRLGGMKQVEIAELVGVSLITVKRWLRGRR
jgi:hypothetical protein